MEEKHKKCFKCGEIKPLSAFYKHSKMADGHVNKCKECNKKDVILNRLDKVEYYNEYDRNRSYPGSERSSKFSVKTKLKYATDPEFKAKVDRSKSEWALKNKIKRKAQCKLSNALRDGKLIRPTICSACGKTDCEIEGHHWSYLEEHWLDVMWLCTECHGKEHRKINAENRKKSATIQDYDPSESYFNLHLLYKGIYKCQN